MYFELKLVHLQEGPYFRIYTGNLLVRSNPDISSSILGTPLLALVNFNMGTILRQNVHRIRAGTLVFNYLLSINHFFLRSSLSKQMSQQAENEQSTPAKNPVFIR